MLLKDKRLKSSVRLFNQAYGHYKPQIIILSVLGFLSGILEGIGINAVIPLFSFVTGDGSAPTDAISQYIYTGLTILHIPYSLPVILTLIGILFVVKGLLTHVVNYIMAVIGATYERDLRNNLFRSTLEAQWPYLIKQKIGYLEKVLMTDINNSSSLLGFISGAILTATSLAIYIVIALNISITTTLATLAVGLVLFLVFKPLMYKIRKISEKYADITKRVAHFVNQNMIGIKTVKTFSLEGQVEKHGSYAFEELRGQRVKIATMRSLATVFMEPIGIIFICGVFGAAFYLSPNFNFASFAVIIYLIHKIFTYTQKAQKGLHDINELIPYLRSAMQFQANADQEKEHDSGSDKLVFNQTCELNDISFGYTNDHMILDHVSLHVQKGDMLGIIGPSGAGKTTLIDLTLRLYEPQSGKILIDGTPLKNISLKAWRQSIGYMSQDVFLLNASVADNIKFYDVTVSDGKIKEAARLAHIDEFIESQPHGYDTVVGERGMMVSEGQKQRIVLARVLARKPQLLLLDEATSALDNESELAIRKALEDLKGKVTIIMIAHRLATIMSCDRLIAIDNGKIIEEGSPEALMEKKNSYFYKTYHLND